MSTTSDGTTGQHFVVGIGASAGGLEAIERLFDRMPAETGMSFVLVQHLSPDFKSMMDELLSRWTSIPIHRVEDGMPIEPDAIYLMPPKKEMVISDGRLLLTDKDPAEPLTLPIDHFFRSLAQDCGRRAVAVVLSGTGSDGSRGIIDVHESGGLVIVQREETAKFDGMPRNARETGVGDLFLSPDEMPEALTRYRENPRISELTASLDSSKLDEGGLTRVFGMIREHYGLDFSYYKLNTVVRRTERRLMLSKTPHIDDYSELLQEDREELDRLYRDLLIGVTRFFRDEEAFERLATFGVERIIDNAPAGSEVRVWIAGCATGEEAYSVAMVFDELLAEVDKKLQIKIFATDAHRDSLEIAGHGVYPEESLAEMSRDRVAKFFTPVPGGYQVNPRLRQMIVFAPHNLTKDPPFTKIDLITCRNLLIYLQTHAQKKVLSLFHFGLKTGGFLFLGPSESPGDVGDEFEAIDTHWKIYRKRRDVRLPAEMRLELGSTGRGVRSSGLPTLPANQAASKDGLMTSTYDAVMEAVMPPSFLIDDDGRVLHTFGDAGQFLTMEKGRFTSDLFERLLPDLRVPLSTAMRKALKDKQTVRYARVPVRDEQPLADEQATRVYDVTIRPVDDRRLGATVLLIEIRTPKEPEDEDAIDQVFDAKVLTAEQVSSLETELRYTKENLQATIEELETSNEELQATNEELVASNEELQSTNEELHSVNEELYTVNAEHQNKIQQLQELTRDVDNLLHSTEVHTIFLDAELKIRKFTPRVAGKFNFLPQDIGRRIDSFTHNIECDGLAGKIEGVVRSGEVVEEEVRDATGDRFLLRILPYRETAEGDAPDPIAGALLTLVDVTKLKAAADALERSIEQRDRFLAMLSHELRNPLATILNATHVLDRREVDDGLADPIDAIQRQSRHMSTLLDDLLDVTRISQGKIRIHKRPFDVLDTVRNAVDGVKARCEARGQAVSVPLPDGPMWVSGSEPRILQVLTNLLTNASKYSPSGGPIDVYVDRDDEAVSITVRDRGVGIPADQLDEVFDLFVQSDRTLDRSEGGLGVGLTLAKSLVELHGGRLTAASDGPGEGSVFTVSLPLGPPPAPGQDGDDDAGKTRESRELVLVEDNIDAGKMLAFLMEDAGFRVSTAHDGPKGLEMIRDAKPDAAVIDIGLPGMHGYDLARTIRDDDDLGDVFLVALTGYGRQSDRAEALAAGFDEHVVKPVDPGLLADLITRREATEETA